MHRNRVVQRNGCSFLPSVLRAGYPAELSVESSLSYFKLSALIRGEDSPEMLSWKVRGSLRKKEKLVQESLKGYFNEFHRSMLESLYRHHQFLTAEIKLFEQWVTQQMVPYAAGIERLVTIPGVDQLAAQVEFTDGLPRTTCATRDLQACETIRMLVKSGRRVFNCTRQPRLPSSTA